ncbi:MAG: ABC transporter permease [Candidatus Bipolaricaulota bacterium]
MESHSLAIMVTFGNDSANIVLALALVCMPRTARIVRSSTLSAKGEGYIEATRAVGCSAWRTLYYHILPNIFPSLVVQATFVFAYAVLGEAGLSFIGVGIQPPTPSLGNIIGDARSIIREGPWMTFLPGITIFFLVMAINLLGDGLREVLDPKRKLIGGK